MEGDENICALCYEAIPVPMFQQVDDTRIEGDCTRLGCGHAMHTACIVRSLQATRGKCALCNMRPARDHDDWDARMRYEHECQKRLQKVRRNPEVSEGLKDYKAFRSELCQKRIEANKRLREFKAQLREEFGIVKLMKDIATIKRQTRANFHKIAKKEGGMYLAAAQGMRNWELNRWLFSERRFSEWSFRRTFW
jgi:hypothetical protein